MKPFTRIVAAVASFLLLAGYVPASAQYNTVLASVPFEFVIDGTTLPRDTYRISRLDGHTDVMVVRSVRRAMFVFGQGLESDVADPMPHLLFHGYGNQYFLREIRFLGTRGLALPETRQEREAAEQIADGSESGAKTVVVVARLE